MSESEHWFDQAMRQKAAAWQAAKDRMKAKVRWRFAARDACIETTLSDIRRLAEH